MATWAPAASGDVAVPRRASRPRTRTRRRSKPRLRVAGGVAWIAIAAVLLAGVVALNVAVLRLNLRLNDLGAQETRLKADNAALASQLSSAGDSLKLEALARKELGLQPAQPDQIHYLDLGK